MSNPAEAVTPHTAAQMSLVPTRRPFSRAPADDVRPLLILDQMTGDFTISLRFAASPL